MVILRAFGVADAALGHAHRGGGFGEIERCLTVNLDTHFLGMCLVISANTENPVDRKQLVAAENGNGLNGWW